MTEAACSTVETEVDTSELEASLQHAEAIAYLASEFPDWTFTVDTTSGWNGRSRELWAATQVGHHTQRELTPAKLYRRLDEYEDRERQRRALAEKVLP